MKISLKKENINQKPGVWRVKQAVRAIKFYYKLLINKYLYRIIFCK